MDFMWQKMSQFGGFLGNLVYKVSRKYTAKPMEVQNALLLELMETNKDTEYGKLHHFADVHNFDDFQRLVPITEFSDFEPYVERMLKGEENLITYKKIKRYVKTSGSSGKPKLIPLCGKAIWNFQCMGFCASLASTANYYKNLGRKLPAQRSFLALEINDEELENGAHASYMSAMPFIILKPLARFFSSSPLELLYPEHSEEMDMNYLKLRFAIENKKITSLCAALITYLVNLFETLEESWEMLCDDIEKGTINPSIRCPEDVRKKLLKHCKPNPERAEELRREFRKGFDTPDAPIATRIWPLLEWTEAMRRGTLTFYADKLKKYCGDLPYINAGLVASEALMAMSLEMSADDGVLLPRSALFEFIPMDNPNIEKPLLMDQLEEGKDYEIILTNLGGLYRYQMHDVVRCTGFYQKTPKVDFLYRSNLVLNITGEKTTQLMIDWAMEHACKEIGCDVSHFCSYGDEEEGKTPCYVFLLETEDEIHADEFADVLDKYLKETNEYYDIRRQKSILDRPVVKFLKLGTFDSYANSLREKGVNLNQVKPVTILNTDDRMEKFLAGVEEESTAKA